MKALFFDLDGTLVDTLPGISKALNDALKEVGVPFSYSERECRSLIGRGADRLLHQALKDLDGPDLFSRAKKEYLPRYEAYQIEGSRPYPNMKETLLLLKERADLLFVYTNKPEKLAKELLAYHFGEGIFLEIAGQLESRAVKPNPGPLFEMMGKYRIPKEESYYVGDSVVDRETAEAAGLPLVLCAYGYGSYDEKWVEEAAFVAKEPADIAKMAL